MGPTQGASAPASLAPPAPAAPSLPPSPGSSARPLLDAATDAAAAGDGAGPSPWLPPVAADASLVGDDEAAGLLSPFGRSRAASTGSATAATPSHAQTPVAMATPCGDDRPPTDATASSLLLEHASAYATPFDSRDLIVASALVMPNQPVNDDGGSSSSSSSVKATAAPPAAALLSVSTAVTPAPDATTAGAHGRSAVRTGMLFLTPSGAALPDDLTSQADSDVADAVEPVHATPSLSLRTGDGGRNPDATNDSDNSNDGSHAAPRDGVDAPRSGMSTPDGPFSAVTALSASSLAPWAGTDVVATAPPSIPLPSPVAAPPSVAAPPLVTALPSTPPSATHSRAVSDHDSAFESDASFSDAVSEPTAVPARSAAVAAAGVAASLTASDLLMAMLPVVVDDAADRAPPPPGTLTVSASTSRFFALSQAPPPPRRQPSAACRLPPRLQSLNPRTRPLAATGAAAGGGSADPSTSSRPRRRTADGATDDGGSRAAAADDRRSTDTTGVAAPAAAHATSSHCDASPASPPPLSGPVDAGALSSRAARPKALTAAASASAGPASASAPAAPVHANGEGDALAAPRSALATAAADGAEVGSVTSLLSLPSIEGSSTWLKSETLNRSPDLHLEFHMSPAASTDQLGPASSAATVSAATAAAGKHADGRGPAQSAPGSVRKKASKKTDMAWRCEETSSSTIASTATAASTASPAAAHAPAASAANATATTASTAKNSKPSKRSASRGSTSGTKWFGRPSRRPSVPSVTADTADGRLSSAPPPPQSLVGGDPLLGVPYVDEPDATATSDAAAMALPVPLTRSFSGAPDVAFDAANASSSSSSTVAPQSQRRASLGLLGASRSDPLGLGLGRGPSRSPHFAGITATSDASLSDTASAASTASAAAHAFESHAGLARQLSKSNRRRHEADASIIPIHEHEALETDALAVAPSPFSGLRSASPLPRHDTVRSAPGRDENDGAADGAGGASLLAAHHSRPIRGGDGSGGGGGADSVSLRNGSLSDVLSQHHGESEFDSEEARLQRERIRRDQQLDELLTTERNYVGDLQILVDHGFSRLNRAAPLWIPAEKRAGFIRNGLELLQFQTQFLEWLETARAADLATDGPGAFRHVAQLFVDQQEAFEVYIVFCTQHDTALRILAEYERKSEMQTFASEFRKLAATKLDLRDYLIKPIQRICRYPLILRELVKHADASHPDYAVLSSALAAAQASALKIDSAKGFMENLQRTDRFFSRLENPQGVDVPPRAVLGEMMILASALLVCNHDHLPSKIQFRGVFLFPNYLFVVKTKRSMIHLKLCLRLSACDLILSTGRQTGGSMSPPASQSVHAARPATSMTTPAAAAAAAAATHTTATAALTASATPSTAATSTLKPAGGAGLDDAVSSPAKPRIAEKNTRPFSREASSLPVTAAAPAAYGATSAATAPSTAAPMGSQTSLSDAASSTGAPEPPSLFWRLRVRSTGHYYDFIAKNERERTVWLETLQKLPTDVDVAAEGDDADVDAAELMRSGRSHGDDELLIRPTMKSRRSSTRSSMSSGTPRLPSTKLTPHGDMALSPRLTPKSRVNSTGNLMAHLSELASHIDPTDSSATHHGASRPLFKSKSHSSRGSLENPEYTIISLGFGGTSFFFPQSSNDDLFLGHRDEPTEMAALGGLGSGGAGGTSDSRGLLLGSTQTATDDDSAAHATGVSTAAGTAGPTTAPLLPPLPPGAIPQRASPAPSPTPLPTQRQREVAPMRRQPSTTGSLGGDAPSSSALTVPSVPTAVSASGSPSMMATSLVVTSGAAPSAASASGSTVTATAPPLTAAPRGREGKSTGSLFWRGASSSSSATAASYAASHAGGAAKPMTRAAASHASADMLTAAHSRAATRTGLDFQWSKNQDVRLLRTPSVEAKLSDVVTPMQDGVPILSTTLVQRIAAESSLHHAKSGARGHHGHGSGHGGKNKRSSVLQIFGAAPYSALATAVACSSSSVGGTPAAEVSPPLLSGPASATTAHGKPRSSGKRNRLQIFTRIGSEPVLSALGDPPASVEPSTGSTGPLHQALAKATKPATAAAAATTTTITVSPSLGALNTDSPPPRIGSLASSVQGNDIAAVLERTLNNTIAPLFQSQATLIRSLTTSQSLPVPVSSASVGSTSFPSPAAAAITTVTPATTATAAAAAAAAAATAAATAARLVQEDAATAASVAHSSTPSAPSPQLVPHRQASRHHSQRHPFYAHAFGSLSSPVLGTLDKAGSSADEAEARCGGIVGSRSEGMDLLNSLFTHTDAPYGSGRGDDGNGNDSGEGEGENGATDRDGSADGDDDETAAGVRGSSSRLHPSTAETAPPGSPQSFHAAPMSRSPSGPVLAAPQAGGARATFTPAGAVATHSSTSAASPLVLPSAVSPAPSSSSSAAATTGSSASGPPLSTASATSTATTASAASTSHGVPLLSRMTASIARHRVRALQSGSGSGASGPDESPAMPSRLSPPSESSPRPRSLRSLEPSAADADAAQGAPVVPAVSADGTPDTAETAARSGPGSGVSSSAVSVTGSVSSKREKSKDKEKSSSPFGHYLARKLVGKRGQQQPSLPSS